MLNQHFKNITHSPVAGYSARALSSVNIPGVAFSFRTYHPSFLWRNNIHRYFETIIDKINLHNSSNIHLKPSAQLTAELEQLITMKNDLIYSQKYEEAARCIDREKKILAAIEGRFV